jgi:hypothetical protein
MTPEQADSKLQEADHLLSEAAIECSEGRYYVADRLVEKAGILKSQVRAAGYTENE